MRSTLLLTLAIIVLHSCTNDVQNGADLSINNNIVFPCGLDENGNAKTRVKCEPEDESLKQNILNSPEFNNSFDWNSNLEDVYGEPSFDLTIVENSSNWNALIIPVFRTSDATISSIIKFYISDTTFSYIFVDRVVNNWYKIDYNTFEHKVNDYYFKLFDYSVCNSDILPSFPDDGVAESLLCEADAGVYTWVECIAVKSENDASTRNPCNVWTFSEWQTVSVPCPPISNGNGGGGNGGTGGDGTGGNNGTGGPYPGGGGSGSGSNGGNNNGGYQPTSITVAEAINNYKFICTYLDPIACSNLFEILTVGTQFCFLKLQAAATFLKENGHNNFTAQSALICALNLVSTTSNGNNPPCSEALNVPYETARQLNNQLFEYHQMFPNLGDGVCSILNTNFTPTNRSEVANYVTNIVTQYINNNPSLPIGANPSLPQAVLDEINLAINVQVFKEYYNLNNLTLEHLISKIPLSCLQNSNFNECGRISLIESFNLIDEFGLTQQEFDDFKNNYSFQDVMVTKIDWNTTSNTQKISQVYYALAFISNVYAKHGGDNYNTQYSLHDFFNNPTGTASMDINAQIDIASLGFNKKLKGQVPAPLNGVRLAINTIYQPNTFHWAGYSAGGGAGFQHFYFPKTGSDEWGFSILNFTVPDPIYNSFIENFSY